MKKKKVKKELDSTIERYLKSNRVFSKTEAFSFEKYKLKSDEDKIKFILDYLKYVDDNKLYNYIIIQEDILRNHYERFLYTEDTYVIILNNSNLFSIIQKTNMKFNHIKIYFLNKKGKLNEPNCC
jgi:hypothetical protein